MRWILVAVTLLAACSKEAQDVELVTTHTGSPQRTPSDDAFLHSVPRVLGASETPTSVPPVTEAAPPEAPTEAPYVEPVTTPVYEPPVSGPDIDERLALRQMVCDAFPSDLFMCNEVVWRESIGDWNPNWRCHVYGPCWSPTSDCGLLQTNAIHRGRYEALGYEMEVGCFIPEVNIQVALGIYADQGPAAWTTYR